MPRESKSGTFFDLSTILMTSFSPHTVGKVFALRSISLLVRVILLTLASCGNLFSSGFICPDSILNLAMILSWIVLGYCTISDNMPSTLILIRPKFSYGSIWISDASDSTAKVSKLSKTCTILLWVSAVLRLSR